MLAISATGTRWKRQRQKRRPRLPRGAAARTVEGGIGFRRQTRCLSHALTHLASLSLGIIFLRQTEIGRERRRQVKNRTDGRNWSRTSPEVALFALADYASMSDCRRFGRQSDRHLNDSHSPPLPPPPPPSPHICFGIWVFVRTGGALDMSLS